MSISGKKLQLKDMCSTYTRLLGLLQQEEMSLASTKLEERGLLHQLLCRR